MSAPATPPPSPCAAASSVKCPNAPKRPPRTLTPVPPAVPLASLDARFKQAHLSDMESEAFKKVHRGFTLQQVVVIFVGELTDVVSLHSCNKRCRW